jgi:uncharacterized protein (TIGR02302 family)
MHGAALVLAWESLSRLAWPLVSWILLFFAVVLIDLLPHLTPLWHGAALALFALGLLLAAWPLRRFRWPNRAQCQRRLEQDSGLAHRPLAQLDDRPAGKTEDEVGRALWRLQRRRLRALLAKIRLRPPEPTLPARDPLGLRFAPLLLLAIGLTGGRHDIAARLDRALDPGWQAGTAALSLQIWITPPAYTGQSPFMLDPERQQDQIRIPAGSKLLAELQGAERDARLFVDGRKLSFTRLDAVSQKLETELTEGHSLALRSGRHLLASWRVEVVPDRPPEVAFAQAPRPLPDGKLQVAIEASDDYGVTALSLLLRRHDGEGGEDEVALPAAGGQKQVHAEMVVGLAAHPWSGLEVRLSPVAADGGGHRSVGAAVTMTLPEREFRHPVARALAAARRNLARDPGQRLPVVDRLGQLMSRPSLFGDDTVAFLQMSTTRSRLIRDRGAGAIASVLDMLWAAALRIEEGDVQDARDAVDQASQALADALQRGASDAELTQLTEQLNDAMQRLMASLAKRGAATAPPPPASQGDGRAVTPQQLQAMLRQMSDLAHAGAREAAQQSLQNLRNLLDQLTAGDGGGEMAQQWQKGMEALQSLAEEQKRLLDRTYRRTQQRQGGAGAERQAQAALRDKLQKLMQSLPDESAIPALGQAGRAMQQAEQKLGNEMSDDAVDSEGKALAKLQEGARQMAEALARAAGGGSQQDPLGRALPDGQNVDDGKVKIPSQSDLGKSREILDELRRRASQADRTPEERAYLKRLLDKLY